MSIYDKLKLSKQERRNISFEHLTIIRNTVFWIDPINESLNKNNAIFARPFNDKNAHPQQLTGNKFNIKRRQKS